MTKIRVLVADDEPLARRGVRQLLARHADIAVVGESRNGPEALRDIEALTPDLLFLDIQMPEMDGFEVIRARGADLMPAVIFVTAHDQFAVRAFEEHALDYLVKPLNIDRFESALQHARERLRLLEAAGQARRLAALLAAERTRHQAGGIGRLVVSGPVGDVVIPVADIDWIGADDYYAIIHARGKSHLLRESLNSLEVRLNPLRFMRIHRSALVQLDRVRELRTAPGGIEAVLLDGTCLPVSRRKRASLDDRLRHRAH